MAHWIDPFLQALIERGAKALVLVSGEPPAFRFQDKLVPASRQAISLEHLLALVRTGLKTEMREQMEVCGSALWFDAVGGRRWKFEATGGPSHLRLEIAPQGLDSDPDTISTASVPGRDPAVQGPNGSKPRNTVAESVSVPPASEPAAVQAGREATARAALEAMLCSTHAMRASDLHLTSGMPPLVRLDGVMQPLDGRLRLPAEELRELVMSIAPERNREELESLWDTDFGYEIAGVSRFRVNLFTDRTGLGAVFRVIPNQMPKPEQLGLPPRLVEMTQLSKGIVLVTGPTGSGKSTTLAALVDHINDTRHDHVVTIEDPIEFVHESRNCLVNQREVGTHAQSFKRALREALREDPDIVLVGEMRDLETVHIALETAETGHLVFGTLHTTSAPATIDRLIDQFPAAQQPQIRVMLADTLRCVVAQVLCRRKAGGRVAALELMVSTPAIANLIREGKTHQIPSIMQTSKSEGMQLMTDELVRLVQENVIDADEALARATDRDEVLRALDRLDLLPDLGSPGRKRR